MSVQSSRITSLLLLSLLFGGVMAVRQVLASEKPDLQVQVSLVSSDTFSWGEPLVLKYEIRNSTSQSAATYMGKDQRGWVTKTLIDAQGHSVATKVGQPWIWKGGVHMDSISISSMGSASGYLVFNPWTTLPAPGKYTFTVHTRLPYVLETQVEAVAPEKYEEVGSVAVNAFTFTLNVTPHSTQVVQRTARGLRQKLQTVQPGDWSSAEIEALFSMPETDVSSVWQDLISDSTTPSFVLGSATDQLVRLHSITAADLVAQMRWEPARPLAAGETSIGVIELDKMYQLGDAKVKKHIDELYAAHGDPHKYVLGIAD